MKTAILVDGGFFLRRYRRIYGDTDPAQAASKMHDLCTSHLYDRKTRERGSDLYRILFYDCPPIDKKAHLPISRKSIDYAKTDTYAFRTGFHKELKKLRKIALRMGNLRDGDGWILYPDATKQLIQGKIKSEDLKDEHFTYDVVQKSVDMKIGLASRRFAISVLWTRSCYLPGIATSFRRPSWPAGKALMSSSILCGSRCQKTLVNT